MSKKYLITGVAGTGKSSLAKELSRRGLAAYDTEEGFSYYVNKDTRERVANPANPSPEWYEKHERVFDEKVLENLFKKHTDETLYIASITANQKKYYPQFDKIFLLTAPNNLLMDRLGSRTGNYFGRHPVELERVISRHQDFDDELLAAGAVAIDATRPIEEVANDILSQTSQ